MGGEQISNIVEEKEESTEKEERTEDKEEKIEDKGESEDKEKEELEKRKEKFLSYFKKKSNVKDTTQDNEKIDSREEPIEASDKESKDQIEIRKDKFIGFFKQKWNWLVYIVLAIIIYFGFHIRTQNLRLLRDVTTNKYIPLALDPFAVLRYANYILENGKLMAIDLMRYYPTGFSSLIEFNLLSNFIVYLYKFLSFFSPGITLDKVHVLYPPIAFIFIMVFFFLFLRKIFDYKIALLATAFLAVLPPFLYRTMAGFSDKEALAILFMFVAFYFYVSAWKSEKLINAVLLGLAAGITTALMALTWGGSSFVFLTIGLFALIELFLNKFKEKDFFVYTAWALSSIIILNIAHPIKFAVKGLLTSTTGGIVIFSFFVGLLNYLLFDLDLLKIKVKVKEKMPLTLASFGIAFILGIIALLVISGPSFFIEKLSSLYIDLTKPFGTNRWVLTVAESHQPYVKDWFNDFGRSYSWAFIFGAVLLFYETVKPLKKKAWKLTAIFAIFILGFIFSRYTSNSTFNGLTRISQFTYIGSLVMFILVIAALYLYSFYKNKDIFREITKFDKSITFVLVWFLIMVVAARSAIRLLIVFAPVTAFLFSYFVFKVSEKISLKFKTNIYRYIVYVIIAILVISTFTGFAGSSLAQGKFTGPSYNQQWQLAGQWIRENTREDAVFAHWWDYGYWVQTGGGRATLTDGGNAGGYELNHWMGRHVITGQSEKEALEFLKAKNATHLLLISDEIGKYPAFSSIGSDENYDRYAWITTFSLDVNNIQETRNQTIYVYTGGHVLDEDFVWQGTVYPRRAAGIGAVTLPTISDDSGNTILGQPSVILVYGAQQATIPLRCVFFDNNLYEFNVEGIDGCFRIIPNIANNNQMNPIGNGLYLSPKVRRTLFTQLYLFNQDSENFKLAYNDENSLPLSIYQGRLIGPLKIWEIGYPDNLEVPEEYYKNELPNSEVTVIKPEYA